MDADAPEIDEDEQVETPDWLAIARSCVGPDDWAEIVNQQIEKARDGDRYATEFVASFVMPKDRGDPTSSRVREVRLVLAVKPADRED